METLIVIPARYGSKRFPGKPLAVLAGKPILQRVWEIAEFVCSRRSNCSAVVATETPSENCPSDKIVDFCRAAGIPVVVTSDACRSGSDRAWEVASAAERRPDVVVNLQGDVPTCPPDFVLRLIAALESDSDSSVASVYVQLSWDALDALRAAKRESPFSGTTTVLDANERALWFSKNIIPAIRKESELRAASPTSPVKRHVGLYAYRYDALKFFANSTQSYYERLEQLEQLRFLENGYRIKMIEGAYPQGYDQTTSGVDSQDDLARVEEIIRKNGELLDFYR